MIDFSADQILDMNVGDLKELRTEVAMAQPEGGLPTDAYLEFSRLIDAVEKMRTSPPNGENLAEAAHRFEELGGKAALERTIGRLNALDFNDL